MDTEVLGGARKIIPRTGLNQAFLARAKMRRIFDFPTCNNMHSFFHNIETSDVRRAAFRALTVQLFIDDDINAYFIVSFVVCLLQATG